MSEFKYFDPQKNIGYEMGSTLRDIRSEMDKRQAEFGFTRNEWLIVGILIKANNTCLNQCDIRKYLGIEDSYLTKVLDKLIDKKIIKKVICGKDRRQRLITLHPKAEALVENIVKEIIEANEKYLHDFSESDKNQLFEFLRRIRENVDACKDPLPQAWYFTP